MVTQELLISRKNPELQVLQTDFEVQVAHDELQLLQVASVVFG